MEAALCKRRIRTHGKAFLSVRLYLINVNETAEHFGSKFCVGPYMTPGKVYGWFKFQKFVSKSFLLLLNFENARKNILKSANFFVGYCVILYKKKNLRSLVYLYWIEYTFVALSWDSGLPFIMELSNPTVK